MRVFLVTLRLENSCPDIFQIVGDGTTAEGDMHDAMNAASVWQLPLLIMVTDNEVAISTKPSAGRGIKDFLAQLFEISDTDHDGSLDKAEAAEMITWLYTVHYSEAPTQNEIGVQVDRMFASMDANGNGRLEFDELMCGELLTSVK